MNSTKIFPLTSILDVARSRKHASHKQSKSVAGPIFLQCSVTVQYCIKHAYMNFFCLQWFLSEAKTKVIIFNS